MARHQDSLPLILKTGHFFRGIYRYGTRYVNRRMPTYAIKAFIREIGLDWQFQMNDQPRSIIDMQIGEKK